MHSVFVKKCCLLVVLVAAVGCEVSGDDALDDQSNTIEDFVFRADAEMFPGLEDVDLAAGQTVDGVRDGDSGSGLDDNAAEGQLGTEAIVPVAGAYERVIYSDVDGRAMIQGDMCIGSVVDVENSSITEQEFEDHMEQYGTNAVLQPRSTSASYVPLWQSGDIPYEIDASIPVTDPDYEEIEGAINVWNWAGWGHVHWRPRDPSKDVYYVTFKASTNGTSWSHVGRAFNPTNIVALVSKVPFGTILHEMGHAMGLKHEHCHPQRLLEVFPENLVPAGILNYCVDNTSMTSNGDYDPSSIMHYPSFYFPSTYNYNPANVRTDSLSIKNNVNQRNAVGWSDWNSGAMVVNGSGRSLPGDWIVGRFNSDNVDDIIAHRRTNSPGGGFDFLFYISYGGQTNFEYIYTMHVDNLFSLRFITGDFNANGLTDLFAVADGKYWMSIDGIEPIEEFRDAPTYDDYDNIVLGDFNSDGRTDILRADGSTWKILFTPILTWKLQSKPWQFVANNSVRGNQMLVGDFDGVEGVANDILYRNEHNTVWWYWRGGQPSPTAVNWVAIGHNIPDWNGLRVLDMTNDGKTDIVYREADTGNIKVFHDIPNCMTRLGQFFRQEPEMKYLAMGHFDRTTHFADLIMNGVVNSQRIVLTAADIAGIRAMYP